MWTQWQTGMLLWFGRGPLIQWLLMQSIRRWTQELLWWCLLLASTYTAYSHMILWEIGLTWLTVSSCNLKSYKPENVKLLHINATYLLHGVICPVLSFHVFSGLFFSNPNRYTRFVKGFLESGEKHFFVDFRVTYYIFTDNEKDMPKVSCCLLYFKIYLVLGIATQLNIYQ